MQLFHIYYDGKRYPMFASNHVAVRRLAVHHLANLLGAVETDKVAVVDPAVAGHLSELERYGARKHDDVLSGLGDFEAAYQAASHVFI